MIDQVIYTSQVKMARSRAVLAALDDHASAARLLICAGSIPDNQAAPLPANVLVTLAFTKPAGVVNVKAELVIGPIQDAMALADGVADWAQLQAGDGAPIANMSVGAAGSGAAIILTDTNLKAGALIRVTLAKLIEP